MAHLARALLVLPLAALLTLAMDPFDLTDTDFNGPLNLIWNTRYPATSGSSGGGGADSRSACNVTDGQSRDGTCMNAAQCRINRGRSGPRGSCRLWNTCCVFEKSSGQTTSARVSYFSSPPSPRQQAPVHRMFVRLASRNVCQMRIDLVDVLLAPATPTPPTPAAAVSTACRSDVFFVEPATLTDVRAPEVCGTQTNQHFYVHLNANQALNSGISLNVRLAPSSPAAATPLVEPHWLIKVTQLECPTHTRGLDLQGKDTRNQVADDLTLLAPLGCLQYFTDASGTVSNFGFASPTDSAFNSNQDYAICFRRWPYTCGVQMTFDYLQLHATAAICASEYLYIPEAGSPTAPAGSTPAPTQCVSLDSGSPAPPPTPRPPTVFTSAHPGPFYLHVHSDAAAPADDGTHGFRFAYAPINCSA